MPGLHAQSLCIASRGKRSCLPHHRVKSTDRSTTNVLQQGFRDRVRKGLVKHTIEIFTKIALKTSKEIVNVHPTRHGHKFDYIGCIQTLVSPYYYVSIFLQRLILVIDTAPLFLACERRDKDKKDDKGKHSQAHIYFAYTPAQFF